MSAAEFIAGKEKVAFYVPPLTEEECLPKELRTKRLHTQANEILVIQRYKVFTCKSPAPETASTE